MYWKGKALSITDIADLYGKRRSEAVIIFPDDFEHANSYNNRANSYFNVLNIVSSRSQTWQST